MNSFQRTLRASLLCSLLAVVNETASGQASFGNALNFNGSNQGVIVTNFGNIIPTTEITVEFWARTTKSSGASAFVLNPDAFTSRFTGIINYGTPPAVGLTYWDFGDINTSGRLGPVAAPANSITNWVHYAFVASQSGNSMSIYTNGVLQSTKTGMTPFVRGNYNLEIGGTTTPYNGRLDDFRVWSVARSAAQIQANYTAPLVGNEPGLLLYYKFDSSSGNVATNSATATGAAYNGTLTNSPTWVNDGTNPPPTTLMAVTLPATGVSNTVAQLNGTATLNGSYATAWFEWGLFPANNTNTTTPASLGHAASPAVSGTLSGLTPGLTYHCRLVVSNVLGTVVRGGDVMFGSPAVALNNAASLTNECHAAFTDPYAANPVSTSRSPLAISGGNTLSMALRADGTVTAWGVNTYTQTNVPSGLSNVVSIAAGSYHNLALKSDGTVVAWGTGTNTSGTAFNNGQAIVPAGLTNVVAVAAGYNHSAALKGNGTVVVWGDNGNTTTTNVPASVTNAIAIAAGQWHTAALQSNGTVVAWGYNVYTETNVPTGLSNVVAIAAGLFHNLALKSDGTVVAWGAGTTNTGSSPNYGQSIIPSGLSNVVAIAAGAYHSLAIKSDGTVIAWGSNSQNQTNVPAGLTNVVAIAGGNTHSLALQADGTLVGWGGFNVFGITTAPASLTNVTLTVTTGGSFNTNNSPGSYQLTYIVTNGLGGTGTASRTVVVQDTTRPGITMLGSNPLTNSLNVPFVDPGATALDACAGGVAIVTNSTVNVSVPGSYTVTYTATDNYTNTTNIVRTVWVFNPPAVTTLSATGVSNTVATLNGTANPGGLATTAWFEWINSTNTSSTNSTAPVSVGSGTSAVAINASLSGLTPGVIYGGRVVGSNSLGVVGGNVVYFGSPSLVLNGTATITNECHTVFADPGITVSTTPQVIAAGLKHGLVLKKDGLVTAWGDNSNGQTNVPAGLVNVTNIASGEQHSLAIKNDGTVVAWGNDLSGQVDVPGGLSNVIAVAGGGQFSVALKSDGTVTAWGNNSLTETNIPPGLNNVVGIAAGTVHTLALKSDGTVTGWGYNNVGQTTIPAGLTDVKAIAAGGGDSLALRTNGTVVAWGDNTYGQTNVPASLNGVMAIACGYSHSLALKTNGTVVAWGDNTSGATNVPSTLSNVVAIAAGQYFSLALRSDGTIVGWGNNGNHQTNTPTSFSVTGTVSTNAPGSYTLKYATTNSLGGIATTTRTVVVQDTVGPVITRYGSSPLTNIVNVAFVDPGALAVDACGGNFVVTTNNPVDVTIPGTYTITYTSTDSYGNSTTNTRTVVVIASTTVWTVSSANDSGTGSLRAVVAGATPGDTIQFTNSLSGSNIVLTSGAITINKTLTIDASSLPGGIRLDGNASSRVLNITAGTVYLTGLTITNGKNGGSAGILNSASLIMDRCAVVGNNGSGGGGGGISSSSTGAQLFMRNCTVANNQAVFGAGILSGASNCIMSLYHCTISSNTASGGTGGIVLGSQGLGILENTIIAGNLHPGNANDADMGGSAATLLRHGNNIIGVQASYGSVTPIGSPNTNGDFVGFTASPFNPMLAPLDNFGGPTPCMPPIPGSRALNACTNGTSLLVDQRGFPRVVNSYADIGAVEAVFNPTLSASIDGLSNAMILSFEFPFTNLSGRSFSILASANATTPLTNWSNLGLAVETPAGSGKFQFADPAVTNNAQRFYDVKAQ